MKEIYIGLENDDFDDEDDYEVWLNGLVIARKSHQSEGAEPLKFLIAYSIAEDDVVVAMKEFLQRSDFGRYFYIEAPPKE